MRYSSFLCAFTFTIWEVVARLCSSIVSQRNSGCAGFFSIKDLGCCLTDSLSEWSASPPHSTQVITLTLNIICLHLHIHSNTKFDTPDGHLQPLQGMTWALVNMPKGSGLWLLCTPNHLKTYFGVISDRSVRCFTGIYSLLIDTHICRRCLIIICHHYSNNQCSHVLILLKWFLFYFFIWITYLELIRIIHLYSWLLIIIKCDWFV